MFFCEMKIFTSPGEGHSGHFDSKIRNGYKEEGKNTVVTKNCEHPK